MAPSRVYRATDEFAREVVSRLARWGLLAFGFLVILLGFLIAPIPGPGGVPVIAVGLMIVLRNSFYARRQFVKMQRRHPKMVFPIRRLLRREPQIVLVFWQQTLRVERILLPRKLRVLMAMRRRWRRRSNRDLAGVR
jgi:hypothetical protein